MSKMLEKTKNFLVYLFLFLLPWQTRLIWHAGELNGGYWEYGTISIYATEIVLWLAVILHLIKKLKFKDLRFKIKDLRLKKLSIVNCQLSIVICYFLVLSLFALRPGLHFYYLFRFLEGAALFWLIRQVDLKKASLVFIAGMVPQALLGVWQFLAQSSFASKWLGMALHDPSVFGTFVVETASGRWLRAYGGLPHPNILGGYLVVVILLLFWLNGREQKTANYESPHQSKLGAGQVRIMNYGPTLSGTIHNSLFIILISALFFTFSRSAWAALFIGLLIYWFIVKEKRKAIIHNSLFIILIFLILGTIFREPALARLQNQNRLEVKSKTERMSGYHEAWQVIRRHPIVGVGLGNYTYAAWKELDSSRPSYAYQPVHNIFLLLLAEIGIVGIILLIFLFYDLLKKSIVHNSLFIILIIGFFDHYLLTLYPGIMLLFFIVAIARNSQSQIYRS